MMNKAEAAARLRFAMKERGLYDELKRRWQNYTLTWDVIDELCFLREETIKLLAALGYRTDETKPSEWLSIFALACGHEEIVSEDGWPTGVYRRVA